MTDKPEINLGEDAGTAPKPAPMPTEVTAPPPSPTLETWAKAAAKERVRLVWVISGWGYCS